MITIYGLFDVFPPPPLSFTLYCLGTLLQRGHSVELQAQLSRAGALIELSSSAIVSNPDVLITALAILLLAVIKLVNHRK